MTYHEINKFVNNLSENEVECLQTAIKVRRSTAKFKDEASKVQMTPDEEMMVKNGDRIGAMIALRRRTGIDLGTARYVVGV